MKLNRTASNWTGLERDKINENWDIIEGDYNNVVDSISEEAFNKVIEGSKIDWSQMVDTVNDLPSNAKEGETRGVKADNKIYRFNGTDWIPINEINLNPIAEVDQRLTSQLAEEAQQRQQEIDTLQKEKADKSFVNNELKRKVSKGDVSVYDIDKNKGLLDETYFTEEVKEQWAGNTPIHSTVANKSLLSAKLADKSVEADITNFLERGKNLYNKDDVTKGYIVRLIDGELSESTSGHACSGFIRVNPNETYIKKHNSNPLQVVFYDAEKQYIDGQNIEGPFTTPADCYYVRINVHRDFVDVQQLEQGTESTPFEPFGYRFKEDLIIENGLITFDKTDFVIKSKNLYNKEKINEGLVVRVSDGKLTESSSGHSSSDFIKVDPGESYTKLITTGLEQVAFYNDIKEFIGSINVKSTFTTPEECNYVRFNIHKDHIDLQQLEKGTAATPYEPYGYKFKYDANKKTEIETDVDLGIRYSLTDNTSDCERIDGLNISDLDDLYPFNSIKLCSLQRTEWGAVDVIYDDDPRFRRDGASGEVMVEIPKHYFKRCRKDGYEYIEISGVPKEGFSIDPAFVENGKELEAVYVGVYDGYDNGFRLRSISGQYPTRDLSITDLREKAKYNGKGFGLLDYRTLSMIQRLFMVYFADRNSQTAVGWGFSRLTYQSFPSTLAINNASNSNYIEVDLTGYTNRPFLVGDTVTVSDEGHVTENREVLRVEDLGDDKRGITFAGNPVDITSGTTRIYHTPQRTGLADGIEHHTGSADTFNVQGHDAIKLFHIENLWGNVWNYIDGIVLSNLVAYVGENMDDYVSDITQVKEKYKPLAMKFPEQTSNVQDSNIEYEFFIKNLAYDKLNPAYQVPLELGTSSHTRHFADPYYAYDWEVAIPSFGGGWDLSFRAGIFTTRFWYGFDTPHTLNAGRLIYKPI